MNCIVNVTENWGIGYENQLLVSISADLKRFRQLTTGKTVVLGRKTLETFPGGKPLKNRRNLVLSRNPDLKIPGAEVFSNVEDLLKTCKGEDLWIIGGSSIYELFLPYYTTVHLTRTLGEYPADAFFPNLDQLGWHKAEEPVQEENGIKFQYVTYTK